MPSMPEGTKGLDQLLFYRGTEGEGPDLGTFPFAIVYAQNRSYRVAVGLKRFHRGQTTIAQSLFFKFFLGL